jgi:hypothetical protein
MSQSASSTRRTAVLTAIAGIFAMVVATSASAAPLAPSSRFASVLDRNLQTVHLVCDNYGRCYRSRRYVRAPYPYYDNGYYPGYYGYGPSIFFGFGGHHFDGGHGFGGHGFGGYAGHGFGGHGGGHHW